MELCVYVQSPVLYFTMELLFLQCHVLFDCLEADLQEGLQLALQWSHLPARLECDSSDATSAASPDSSIIFIRFIKSGSLLEKGILWVVICLAVKI
jgi:hypothetical protein